MILQWLRLVVTSAWSWAISRKPLLSLLIVVGCNSSLTTSSDVIEIWIVEEYVEAQSNLYLFYEDARIYDVPIQSFTLQVVPPTGQLEDGRNYFDCNKTRAVGCYHSSDRRIEYLAEAPTVLRHEFGHGIADVLHLSKDGCEFQEWEHVAGCGYHVRGAE